MEPSDDLAARARVAGELLRAARLRRLFSEFDTEIPTTFRRRYPDEEESAILVSALVDRMRRGATGLAHPSFLWALGQAESLEAFECVLDVIVGGEGLAEAEVLQAVFSLEDFITYHPDLAAAILERRDPSSQLTAWASRDWIDEQVSHHCERAKSQVARLLGSGWAID